MLTLFDHKRSEVGTGPGADSLDERNSALERYKIAGQVLLFTGAAAFATGLSLVLLSPKVYRVEVAVGAGALNLQGNF